MPRPKILGRLSGMAKILVDREHDRILGANVYTHPSLGEVFNPLPQ